MKIQLVDYNKEMCDEWLRAFSQKDSIILLKDIDVRQCSLFSVLTDCFVSPANSFGFLDGGIDNEIRKYYEREHNIDVQRVVQEKIYKDFDGELLVGQAIYVPFHEINRVKKIPDLIVAPTMRVPMSLENDSVNVYLAARAIFKTLKLNKSKINSVSISGLGTGIGQFPYNLCAKQMRKAYDNFWLGEHTFPPTWGEAQDRHQLLFSDTIIGDLQYKKNQTKN